MAGQYRYLFGNWQTARVDAEISLYGVYIVGKLNDIGYMQGSFQLDQEDKTNKDNQLLTDVTEPYRNFIVVLRDEVPIWGGYITSRTYQSQSKSIQLYAKAYEGYFDDRIIPKSELDNTATIYEDFDQGTAFYFGTASFRFDRTHAGPLFPLSFNPEDSNVPFGEEVIEGIPYSGPITGVLKDWIVYRTDYKTYRQMVDELANSDDGFDWRIVPRLEVGQSVIQSGSGLPPQDPVPGPLPGPTYDPAPAIEVHKYVLFGYPSLSTGDDGSATVFEYPGNILNYWRTDNLAGAGTNILGIGSGQGVDMFVSENIDLSLVDIRGGYFPKDVVVPMKQISDQVILDARTAQEAVKRRPPKVTYKVDVRPDSSPEFGTWDLGSAATLIIQDAMHPNGVSVPVLVNEYALRPGSSEGGAEEISVGFAGAF